MTVAGLIVTELNCQSVQTGANQYRAPTRPTGIGPQPSASAASLSVAEQRVDDGEQNLKLKRRLPAREHEEGGCERHQRGRTRELNEERHAPFISNFGDCENHGCSGSGC